ncbi:MAG TPA: cation transporter [Gammaproteobacteria bacterium]|nr:cation transporter [Gammaproteobacteria bacterium]
MSYEIKVENIKCGGCAGTISKRLNELEAVCDCEVEVETGIVRVDADETSKLEVARLLLKLGYPESGTTDGLKAAKARAKSFVSCAVGKMSS